VGQNRFAAIFAGSEALGFERMMAAPLIAAATGLVLLGNAHESKFPLKIIKVAKVYKKSGIL
jgi:hypothetical protein